MLGFTSNWFTVLFNMKDARSFSMEFTRTLKTLVANYTRKLLFFLFFFTSDVLVMLLSLVCLIPILIYCVFCVGERNARTTFQLTHLRVGRVLATLRPLIALATSGGGKAGGRGQ